MENTTDNIGKAKKIAEKFKRQHNITGAISEVILESIAESLRQIESATEYMKKPKRDNHGNVISYGFDLDRFGFLKEHPGVGIINRANANIRQSLATLKVSPEAKGSDGGKPKSKLKKMINGGQ